LYPVMVPSATYAVSATAHKQILFCYAAKQKSVVNVGSPAKD